MFSASDCFSGWFLLDITNQSMGRPSNADFNLGFAPLTINMPAILSSIKIQL